MNKYSEIATKVGSLQIDDNLTIRLVLDKEVSWKFRLYFLSDKQGIPDNPSAVLENNVPFISFFNNGKDWLGVVSLAWIFVPPEKRWTDLTDIMFAQFFELCWLAGLEVGKTAQIKKPLLAAKLAKIGFIPERADIVARILWLNKDSVPIVAIDRNDRLDDRKINNVSPKSLSDRAKNVFYYVVEDQSNTWKKVAIQTMYIPPWDTSIHDYIAKSREMINGKVRLFPNRVRRVLLWEK